MTDDACKKQFKFDYASYVTDDSGQEQFIFHFENGYGASVIRGRHSYGGIAGLWELAVLRDGFVYYDSPLTSDVVGWLSDEDVEQYLWRITFLEAHAV